MSSSEGLTRRKNKGDGPAPRETTVPPESIDDEVNKGHGADASDVTDKAASSAAAIPFLERYEAWVPWLLLLITGFTRYYRLDKPTGVVFDEHHFGRFTNQYHAGTYLFDIHPPLGKLVFYYISSLAGYNHQHCSYANIQDQYGAQCKYVVLRCIAAFFGTITSPFLYGIVRSFGGSIRAGIIAALLFTFDGLNTSESRLILIDSQLIFWCTMTLWVAQRWWARWNKHYAALEDFEAKTGYTTSLGFGSLIGGTSGNNNNANPTANAANQKDKRKGGNNNDNKKKDDDDSFAMTLSKEEETEASAFGLLKLTGIGSTSPRTPTPSADPTTTVASSSSSTTAAKNSAVAAPSKAFISLLSQAELLEQDPRLMRLETRLFWWVAVGLTCANAVSIKFTALATPGLVAVESFFAFFFLKRSIPLLDLLAIAAVVIVVFIFYYFLHFGLLPNTGDGDAFMAVDFQRTLVNNTHYDPNARKPGLLRMVWELNQEMVVASARIEQRHHWDSVWWEWIFNLRGILYYSRDAGKDSGTPSHSYTETIYLLGNPLVIWPVLGGLVMLLVLLGLYARYRTDPLYALPKRFDLFVSATIFCFIAYWLNLLPYLAVKRSSFIYHYMPALVYGEIIVALVIEQLAGKRWMHLASCVVVGAAAAGFLIYAPWIYGFPLTSEGHARRRWLSRWD